MTKRLKTAVLCLFCAVASACFLSALFLLRGSVHAEEAVATARVQSYQTVAVHDPSIVLAYEDAAGNTLPQRHSASDKKVYYVFGTQNAYAKSYDLVNWVNFQNNLCDNNKLFALLSKEAQYSYHADGEALRGNIWAPDVIYNPNLEKWCMYLSVNGDHQYSSIVLLTADRLDGDWSYVGPIVYSRITNANMAQTDYQKVTGRSTVAAKYDMWRGGTDGLLYGVNAIDPAVSYDDEGNLWMSYGSWFGGIYLLKLDAQTGLRDYTYTYENNVINNTTKAQIPEDDLTQANYGAGGFTAYTDKYLGIHIAGGHHAGSGGEGSYILKIGDYYYLFLSYGGYAPDGGYNMRVFRSSTITGYNSNGEFVGYKDHANSLALFSVADNSTVTEGSIGARVMSGYTWSNWDFSYVAQGHNSAFTDDDGTSYLIYHNKYMDGTAFHVMKVHRLMVNADGWLACSPFEVTPTDAVATGLTKDDIVGKYGYLYMTRNNGRYGSPVTERDVTLSYSGTSGGLLTGTLTAVSTNDGDKTGTWNYNSATGAFTVRTGGTDYKGYMLYQNIEGTNIRTLTFTAITSAFAYTYWGYRYPTAQQQAEYAASSYVFPSAWGEGANLPQGEITSTLWDGASVTFTREGNDLVLNGTHYPVRESKAIVEAEAAYAGQRFTPVSTTNGISISFDYSYYGADWVSVLHGNGFRIALGVLYDTTGSETHLYEWQDSIQGKFQQFATDVYNALLVPNGTARATVSFHTDGSVSFYRDGVWLFTHKANVLFKNATADEAGRTVGAFTQKVLQAFAAGEVYVDYGMRNVTIGKALNAGLGENFVELGSDISCYGQVKGNATGTSVLSLPSEASGLAVTFRISGANSEWGSIVLQSGEYKITTSNLDAWWTGGTLANTNKAPNSFANGGSVQAFLNRECYITVSVNAEGVVYYRDGVRVITHGKDEYMNYNNAGASTTVKVSDFVTAFLASAANGFTVAGNECGATDLVVTGALTDAQAKDVYLALGHTHAALSLTAHAKVEATCTTAGAEAYWECKTCGKLYSDSNGTTEISAPVSIPAKGHAMTAHPRVEATCTAAGTQAYWECTNCNKLFSNANGTAEISAPVSIPATGHTQSGTYTHVAGTEKHIWHCENAGCAGVQSDCELELISIDRDSCDTAGEGLLRCKQCGYEKTQTYAAGQHAYGAPQWTWTQGTDGYVVTVKFVCAQNDSTLNPEVTVTYKDTAADCTTAGKRVYTASVTLNGAPYTDTKETALPALGHSLTAHAKVEATCTAAGTEAYWECTACNKLFSDKDGNTEISAPVSISAKGHAMTAHAKVEATCTAAGTEAYWECTACNKLFSDKDGNTEIAAPVSISAKGHAMTAHAKVEATCTAAGAEAYWECTACNKLFSDKDGNTQIAAIATIPAKGHTWGEWTVTRDPSATAEGEEQRTCTACGEKETRPVAALGEDKEAEAFRTAVEALEGASGAKELFTAIKTALTAYGKLSQAGKASVAEEYEKVQSAIASYNALANKANAELKSATDAAISAFASGLSAINALAVAWAVLKSALYA